MNRRASGQSMMVGEKSRLRSSTSDTSGEGFYFLSSEWGNLM
jgi:hypothetical protein